MRPGDHPEFFRFPPPEGRSRESTLRLDAQGRFWHEERLVEHAGLTAGLHGWISRHPDDGRYILSNGYDWTYFTVDDAPYFVRSVRVEPQCVVLVLSDRTEEVWTPETSRIGQDGALYARVKPGARGGPFEAKFTPHAQASLAPALVDDPDAPDGTPAVRLADGVHAIAAKNARFG
ncbi:MAG TPA: hypothetical protein VGG39_17900 [Polyangiaceae bacterium]|jgi:hypothetical protein